MHARPASVLPMLVALLALPAVGWAGEPAIRMATASSLVNPHTLELELDHLAQRRARSGARQLTDPFSLHGAAGLAPFDWPRADDMRARLLTPELRRAPLVGWIATNLYRSRRENGWCLEVDPGEGEYLVFYRRHL